MPISVASIEGDDEDGAFSRVTYVSMNAPLPPFLSLLVMSDQEGALAEASPTVGDGNFCATHNNDHSSPGQIEDRRAHKKRKQASSM
jgi:hypothetical protein